MKTNIWVFEALKTVFCEKKRGCYPMGTKVFSKINEGCIMAKERMGFPDESSVFKAAINCNPHAKKAFKILMVYTRALGVYVVLKDVMEYWPIEIRREVEVEVKQYIEDCKVNGWSEKEK